MLSCLQSVDLNGTQVSRTGLQFAAYQALKRAEKTGWDITFLPENLKIFTPEREAAVNVQREMLRGAAAAAQQELLRGETGAALRQQQLVAALEAVPCLAEPQRSDASAQVRCAGGGRCRRGSTHAAIPAVALRCRTDRRVCC